MNISWSRRHACLSKPHFHLQNPTNPTPEGQFLGRRESERAPHLEGRARPVPKYSRPCLSHSPHGPTHMEGFLLCTKPAYLSGDAQTEHSDRRQTSKTHGPIVLRSLLASAATLPLRSLFYTDQTMFPPPHSQSTTQTLTRERATDKPTRAATD
jgi:hypothetical protein